MKKKNKNKQTSKQKIKQTKQGKMLKLRLLRYQIFVLICFIESPFKNDEKMILDK